MENNEKIKVAFFNAGSHLEEKTIEAENEEDYINLIGCKHEYSLSYKALKIGDKTYALFHDGAKKSGSYYDNDSVPSVTNDNFGIVLFGNVVICNHGKNEFSSLTKDDFENIQSHIGYLLGRNVSKVFLFPVIRTNDASLKGEY